MTFRSNYPALLPIPAIGFGPARLGGVDCSEGAFCGDHGFHVIKRNSPALPIAHCEWFCSSLGMRVNVPQAPFNLVQDFAGEICFGSKWTNGKIQDWPNVLLYSGGKLSEVAEDVSRIFALDCFVHNVDRHINNLLVVKGGTRYEAHSIDFSRAWILNGFPLPSVGKLAGTNTVNLVKVLRVADPGYLNFSETIRTLDLIASIGVNDIERIMALHPANWLTAAAEDEILKWWTNGGAAQRVHDIKVGLNNGSLA